jgi:hypothetical protein
LWIKRTARGGGCMADDPVMTIDYAKEISSGIGRILVISLVTAIMLRLSNRISIRKNITYKTAYLASLVTNTILFSMSLFITTVFVMQNLKPVYAYIPAWIISVPLNGLVYQHMIKDESGSSIRFKQGFILSLVLNGIIFAFIMLIVGILLIAGLLLK